jgi:hypothetical protein
MSGSNHFGLCPSVGVIQDTLSGFGLTGTADVNGRGACGARLSLRMDGANRTDASASSRRIGSHQLLAAW